VQLQALLDFPQMDESESAQVPQAWPLVARLLVQEPGPWPRLERRRQELPVRLALPPAQRELRAHLVSRQPAPRSLAVVPQVSSARPSQLLPLLLFPL